MSPPPLSPPSPRASEHCYWFLTCPSRPFMQIQANRNSISFLFWLPVALEFQAKDHIWAAVLTYTAGSLSHQDLCCPVDLVSPVLRWWMKTRATSFFCPFFWPPWGTWSSLVRGQIQGELQLPLMPRVWQHWILNPHAGLGVIPASWRCIPLHHSEDSNIKKY